MNILNYQDFISEKMKIVPLTDDEFNEISDNIERNIWYQKEPKLTKSEITGDIEDCITNVKDNAKYLEYMNNPDVMYRNYVSDVLNIAARCYDRDISGIAVEYLHKMPDEELFKGIIKISKYLGL